MCSHKKQQHPRIRSSKPKHPSKTRRIHADSTQASPPCFYHVIGTPNPLAFASAASFGLAFAWCSQHDTGVSWLVMKIEDILPNCLTKNYIIQLNTILQIYRCSHILIWRFGDKYLKILQKPCWQNTRFFKQLTFTRIGEIYDWVIWVLFPQNRSESWDTLAQVRQCLQFCSLWWRKGGREARWPPWMEEITLLAQRSWKGKTRFEESRYKNCKSVSAFLSFSIILFCFICVMVLL